MSRLKLALQAWFIGCLTCIASPASMSAQEVTLTADESMIVIDAVAEAIDSIFAGPDGLVVSVDDRLAERFPVRVDRSDLNLVIGPPRGFVRCTPIRGPENVCRAIGPLASKRRPVAGDVFDLRELDGQIRVFVRLRELQNSSLTRVDGDWREIMLEFTRGDQGELTVYRIVGPPVLGSGARVPELVMPKSAGSVISSP